MPPRRYLIIGANGGFGVLLSRMLSDAGHAVAGIDLQDAPAADGARLTRYVRADITQDSAEAASLIQGSEGVILSLPEEATLACFGRVVEALAPGSLLVDLLSVKSAVVARMRAVEKAVELLSLHPMFAPGVGLRGQNVIAVEVRPGPLSGELLSLVAEGGARVTGMTAEEHDATTAAVQVATHAAVISFGHALAALGYDVEKALRMSTPPHRVMLALAARILTGDPEIYWRIQRNHPLAAGAREAVARSLAGLDRAAGDDSPAEFERMLDAARRALGPELEGFADYCARLFNAPS